MPSRTLVFGAVLLVGCADADRRSPQGGEPGTQVAQTETAPRITAEDLERLITAARNTVDPASLQEVVRFGELEGPEMLTLGLIQAAVVVWPPDYLLVQIAFLSWTNRTVDVAPIETRVLSLAGGEELFRTDALPRIAAIRDGHVYAFTNDPFPQIIVLAAQPSKGVES